MSTARALQNHRRHRVKEQREKQEREHFGLTWEQQRAAVVLPQDIIALMHAAAAMDGIACRSTGRALAELRGLGFIEIEANGRDATAKLTLDGYRALVLRLRRPHQPQ